MIMIQELEKFLLVAESPCVLEVAYLTGDPFVIMYSIPKEIPLTYIFNVVMNEQYQQQKAGSKVTLSSKLALRHFQRAGNKMVEGGSFCADF
jgi:hypothetical protein